MRFPEWILVKPSDDDDDDDDDDGGERGPRSADGPGTEEGAAAGQEADNRDGSISETGVTTPSRTVTCQPRAWSTPLHPASDGPPESAGLLRNGAKPHAHQLPSNGVKNADSLSRAASSASSPSPARKGPKKLQSNPSINSQASKRSKGSSRSNSSQIPAGAQDDCCVHCILACLFCEFLTLCNIVLDCATCGSCTSDSSCFCCCCGSEECGDCDLPCDMDCGIIDACCESADCLEICMECCGLCFSS
ncbi:myoD family inhibitor isoform X2 [Denticeps clupeoides]|uniref:myoD family inhibitor isoform X2 n=1 Tax=Denticeps clupeoides TaxID=299321 RepID=UPI0010A3A475|nr:myoD family inhibitor isoform X2 [Denticeps clupeoides]